MELGFEIIFKVSEDLFQTNLFLHLDRIEIGEFVDRVIKFRDLHRDFYWLAVQAIFVRLGFITVEKVHGLSG